MDSTILKESDLQRKIQVEVNKHATLFRIPSGNYLTEHGSRVKVAVKGFPDLAGFRRKDGKAVFIEVKTDKGRPSKEQVKFLEVARSCGCLAGIARNTEEALEIINETRKETND